MILDKHAPFRKVPKNKLKFRDKPWITSGIQKSIQVKNKYFTKYIKLKDPEKKNEAHFVYKKYRNLISTILKESKRTYFTRYFQENLNDLKNTWKGIKKIICLKSSQSSLPTAITIKGKTIVHPTEIANSFNDYFTNVAVNIQSSIKFANRNFCDFLSDINVSSFFISPTDKFEVSNIISSLNPLKTIGPNSIPTKVLKMLNKDISDQLTSLFNVSFSTGVFPSLLKVSKIIPVHKKDSKLVCSNYRPISLLSNIDKILERLMYNRLYKFLETNKLIYSLQFGFRQKHSTSHALIHLTEEIRNQLDSGNFGCGIFVDFQKAFDTVDHDILLKKLNHYGIRGLPNNWFSSYLKNRKQFVSINGYNSELKDTLLFFFSTYFENTMVKQKQK